MTDKMPPLPLAMRDYPEPGEKTYTGEDLRAYARAHAAAEAAPLAEALEEIEPYLDAIICYASTMEEHKPNAIAFKARAALAAYKEQQP